MHIFLNCFEVFDKEWRVTEEKPTWINSFSPSLPPLINFVIDQIFAAYLVDYEGKGN